MKFSYDQLTNIKDFARKPSVYGQQQHGKWRRQRHTNILPWIYCSNLKIPADYCGVKRVFDYIEIHSLTHFTCIKNSDSVRIQCVLLKLCSVCSVKRMFSSPLESQFSVFSSRLIISIEWVLFVLSIKQEFVLYVSVYTNIYLIIFPYFPVQFCMH